MTRFGGLGRISRPAVALASVTSCALVGAAAFGAVTPPVVAGAVGAAAVTAVLSAHGARAAGSDRHGLAPLPMGPPATGVAITAPRARDAAAARSVHSAA